MAGNEHKVTISINGRSSNAVSALERVQSSLIKVRQAASRVMSALGTFGMAWQGIAVVCEWINKARSRLAELRTAVERARFAAEMSSAADATARLVGMHERLSRIMKDETDTLAKQKSLRDLKQSITDDNEDGKRAADRARQIYEANTPDEEQRLRDKFAAEDERIAAERKKRDTRNRIKDLDEEESIYSSKANGLRENNKSIAEQIAAREDDRRRVVKDEDREAIDKEIEALNKRKVANDSEIALYEKESKFRRDQIAVLESSNGVDGQTAGYWDRKTEQKKRDQADADADFEQRQRNARESDEAARKFVEAIEKDRERESETKMSRVSSRLESSYALGHVSQNRLTAMGLGSGVKGSDGVSTDLTRIIRILENTLTATRENKPVSSGASTFSE